MFKLRQPIAAQHGFTLVELIVTMLIVGILAVAVLPRFSGRQAFDSRGFYDEVIATLRYAQKAAIAKRRFVCVTLTSSSVSLRYGATGTCADGALLNPSGKASISAPGGVTITAASFSFDSLGQPSSAQNISVSGYATPITVEAETGYVH